MKVISEKEATLIKTNWQRQRQEHIISSFEVFNEQEGEYDRITARDFGAITQEFMDSIQKLGDSPSDGLSLMLGIDENTQHAESVALTRLVLLLGRLRVKPAHRAHHHCQLFVAAVLHHELREVRSPNLVHAVRVHLFRSCKPGCN